MADLTLERMRKADNPLRPNFYRGVLLNSRENINEAYNFLIQKMNLIHWSYN